ncbi:MAG: transglycosylase domain-containing protein [Acidimicrobiales bacterium]|nr:transglycosylase domain-containing protein [Acidimicrobiales bacterium]
MIAHVARELWRSFARLGTFALTALVAIVALSSLLAASLLVVTHQAIESRPELPQPDVDVAAIDDLSAAVARADSRSSVVLDADGAVIGRFNPEEFHRPLAVGEVPAVIEDALLASEDTTFRDHNGFDAVAIARAFATNLVSGDIEQGGSTLTQQLAKNLFTGADDSLDRKLEELQVAVDLEAHFTKDEILAAYANEVFLGNGLFGFEAAARSYFGKPAADLTLSEAALLVGVLPAPTARDPRANPQAAEAARTVVLERVRATGRAEDDDIAAALDEAPTVLAPQPAVENWPYYLDYVRRYLLDEDRIDPDLLYGGGLTIETGLVPEQQFTALVAVQQHIPEDAGPEGAAAVIDVQTGLVTALVGGRSFDDEQVNLALGRFGGGSGRQAGSSFKPFVLAAAIEAGHRPTDRIAAPAEYLPTTVDDPKPVRNFSERGHGVVTLVEATTRSINTAYVSLTEVVGAAAVRDVATRVGVESLPDGVGPSIGIGAYETSPLEMATAYAAFADDGRRVDVGPVRRVLAPDGGVIADFTPVPPAERPQAIDTEVARQVNGVLVENVNRGTATRAQIGRPAAAKTGTSDEYANAWLVGHTPQYAMAVWVGDPAGNIPLRDVAGYARVTGGSIPALIWHDVMAAIHATLPIEPFEAPLPRGPDSEPSSPTEIRAISPD